MLSRAGRDGSCNALAGEPLSRCAGKHSLSSSEARSIRNRHAGEWNRADIRSPSYRRRSLAAFLRQNRLPRVPLTRFGRRLAGIHRFARGLLSLSSPWPTNVRSSASAPGSLPKQIRIEMFKSKCPHCGFKLGQYLYADACPECRHELKHNTRILVAAPTKSVERVRSWPVRLFRSIVHFVES